MVLIFNSDVITRREAMSQNRLRLAGLFWLLVAIMQEKK